MLPCLLGDTAPTSLVPQNATLPADADNAGYHDATGEYNGSPEELQDALELPSALE